MAKTSKTRKPHGKFDAALLALDLALLAGVVLLLWGVDRGFRRQAEIAALKDNRFLTTEWRLMRELKERTDQELRDKDREIDVLRQQYLRLKGSGSSADLLADIEAAMARAESERAAILSARANPEVAPVAAPPSVPSASSLSPGAGERRPGGPCRRSGRWQRRGRRLRGSPARPGSGLRVSRTAAPQDRRSRGGAQEEPGGQRRDRARACGPAPRRGPAGCRRTIGLRGLGYAGCGPRPGNPVGAGCPLERRGRGGCHPLGPRGQEGGAR
jgi:hypothetical protein